MQNKITEEILVMCSQHRLSFHFCTPSERNKSSGSEHCYDEGVQK